jgi:hypothetical protein
MGSSFGATNCLPETDNFQPKQFLHISCETSPTVTVLIFIERDSTSDRITCSANENLEPLRRAASPPIMTMTAIAVQQHGAHRQQYNSRQSTHSSNGPSPGSRPQAYPLSPQRQEPPAHLDGNAFAGVMNPRPAVSNDPIETVNGNGAVDIDRTSTPSAGQRNGASAYEPRASLQARPSSAPKAESSQRESEVDKLRRRSKPLLHRSKSDFGPRGEDKDSQEEEMQDWGARHGFDGHYASEEFVSQLANVSCSSLSNFKTLFLARARHLAPRQDVSAKSFWESFWISASIYIEP